MEITQGISLKAHNTFGVDVPARQMARIEGLDDWHELAERFPEVKRDPLILGGGSNVLFTKPVERTVVLNRIKGIECISESDDATILRVGAGEVWHDFVEHCITASLGGVENLALIPGNVGASPMQNIGAYGTEIVNVFHELEAIHLASGELHRFSKADCKFGYRESVFKNIHKGEYLITHVSFSLRKSPEFNISYGAIQQELDRSGVSELSLRAVADAVIRIRRSKLPDPKVLGNAGSFFKNPVVPKAIYEAISAYRPDAPHYPAEDGKVKLAAGWLIEQAGWKGKRVGSCGVHEKQALVIVNHGGARGEEIYDLSEQILQDVYRKFGVLLEREVNIL